MKLELLVICDYAAEMAGKLVLVGTFDRVIWPSLPIMLATMGVGMRFRLDKGDPPSNKYAIEVRFKAPNGQQLFNLNGELGFQAPPGSSAAQRDMETANMVFTATNAGFTMFGTHILEVWLDKKLVGSHPLFVTQGSPPQAPAGGPGRTP